MANRLFNLAVLFSTVAIGLLGIAWLAAGSFDPRTQHINLSHEWHLGVDSRGVDPRIEIFNGSNGPYSASISSIAGPHGHLSNTPHVMAFGDALGIYFRRIPVPTGGYWCTLSVGFAYPLVAALVLPLGWISLRRRRTSRRRGFTVERSPASA